MTDKLYKGTHEFSLSVSSDPNIDKLLEKISMSDEEIMLLDLKMQRSTASDNDLVTDFVEALKADTFTKKELGYFTAFGFIMAWEHQAERERMPNYTDQLVLQTEEKPDE